MTASAGGLDGGLAAVLPWSEDPNHRALLIFDPILLVFDPALVLLMPMVAVDDVSGDDENIRTSSKRWRLEKLQWLANDMDELSKFWIL
jgi:hypothetical protein